MEKYLDQLLADIAHATEHVAWPYPPASDEEGISLFDWISDEEEDKTAPRRDLEEWTGIRQTQLPPADQLTDEQVHVLMEALKKMLGEYNWHFCVIFSMPERLEYEVLRNNFKQEATAKRWHTGLFDTCKPDSDPATCIMGEFCHCAYFNEMRKNWVDEDLTPEEERRRQLDCEITYLKRRRGDDWMKYYPYHLDADYDDENGNPYNYGFGEGLDDDEDYDDTWWKK